MRTCDFCKFCYSNGESEYQYRSHLLKNSSGLVTCPVLRSFTCRICKATGDFAHTQRYCPLNKDGKFNNDVSLNDLKKKKNAAGNFPSFKKLMWPLNSYSKLCSAYTGTTRSLPPIPPPFKRTDWFPSDQNITTEPPISYYRAVSPPTIPPSQPPPTQVDLDRHLHYLQYYQHKQLHHEEEIARIQAIPKAASARFLRPPPCFMRNYPSGSLMSVTPAVSPHETDLFPIGDHYGMGRVYLGNTARQEQARLVGLATEKKEALEGGDLLGSILANLRVGTEDA